MHVFYRHTYYNNENDCINQYFRNSGYFFENDYEWIQTVGGSAVVKDWSTYLRFVLNAINM